MCHSKSNDLMEIRADKEFWFSREIEKYGKKIFVTRFFFICFNVEYLLQSFCCNFLNILLFFKHASVKFD